MQQNQSVREQNAFSACNQHQTIAGQNPVTQTTLAEAVGVEAGLFKGVQRIEIIEACSFNFQAGSCARHDSASNVRKTSSPRCMTQFRQVASSGQKCASMGSRTTAHPASSRRWGVRSAQNR